MKTIEEIYNECQLIRLEYEESRKKAIIYEEERKRKNEIFKQKLIKSRS